ncbi:hypothetical protein G7068_14115 [Leucobacter viscericola]|uniref:Uncharacterized protein n=1 Tax=Leucobacter viscericola TaxID=2714935 RepID=A0A6G7XIA2_9MICO|nr:hypothetical protein [Leucobacter viscericola]QIK64206.1 hypothetical protein G7068_14115 [Leucobacter viscericola]
MTEGSRRGVTRGYVGSLILAAVIVAVALLVATWGLLSLGMDRDPVSSDGVVSWAAPLVLCFALAALALTLWQQAIALLRGQKTPVWGYFVAVSVGAYLLWSLGGNLAGMSIDDTWVSPFAAALVPIWGLTCLLFWAVLARRLYTDRPTPKWPWERTEEED